MTKKLLIIAAIMIYASLVMGAVTTDKKSEIKVGGYGVFLRTKSGDIKVPFREAYKAELRAQRDEVKKAWSKK